MPYKQVVVVKLMINYSNNKPHDTHGFKKEVQIKYDAVKAVAGRFQNETAVMAELLAAVASPIDWVRYCQLIFLNNLYGKRSDDLNKSMFS